MVLHFPRSGGLAETYTRLAINAPSSFPMNGTVRSSKLHWERGGTLFLMRVFHTHARARAPAERERDVQ